MEKYDSTLDTIEHIRIIRMMIMKIMVSESSELSGMTEQYVNLEQVIRLRNMGGYGLVFLSDRSTIYVDIETVNRIIELWDGVNAAPDEEEALEKQYDNKVLETVDKSVIGYSKATKVIQGKKTYSI